uniref:Uncharacterized protein n=1 Tax=viral metagenome TaxID=1070528 RepID=A0A6C0I871_9ZZZZ
MEYSSLKEKNIEIFDKYSIPIEFVIINDTILTKYPYGLVKNNICYIQKRKCVAEIINSKIIINEFKT